MIVRLSSVFGLCVAWLRVARGLDDIEDGPPYRCVPAAHVRVSSGGVGARQIVSGDVAGAFATSPARPGAFEFAADLGAAGAAAAGARYAAFDGAALRAGLRCRDALSHSRFLLSRAFSLSLRRRSPSAPGAA
jgi:hypothetical protein